MEKREVTQLSIWKHTNGNLYVVHCIANDNEGDDPSKKSKYPPTVVYRGMSGKIWARPLSDWYRSMTFIKE